SSSSKFTIGTLGLPSSSANKRRFQPASSAALPSESWPTSKSRTASSDWQEIGRLCPGGGRSIDMATPLGFGSQSFVLVREPFLIQQPDIAMAVSTLPACL